MQGRLFSLLSQPPVKFVDGVLGEQINPVRLAGRALRREDCWTSPPAELQDVRGPSAPSYGKSQEEDWL